jgi:AcrR family transcriptional regulator
MTATATRKIPSATLPATEGFDNICSTKRDKNLDPRVKRTRELLVEAFKKLMRESEFHKITIQDITELATVNRATFYAHFEDKYDLLDQVVREYFQEMLRSRFSSSHELTEANLRRFILTTFEFLGHIQGDCKHSRRQYEPLIVSQVQVLLREYLLDWFARQNFSDFEVKITQEIAVNTVSWAIFGAAIDWSRSDKKISAEDTINQVLQVITHGLAVLPGSFLKEKGEA